MPEPECLPGWPNDEVTFCVAAELRKGGGRPEGWGQVLKTGDVEDVCKCLRQIPIKEKKPVEGLQRRAWLMAAAWKKKVEEVNSLTRQLDCAEKRISDDGGERSLLRAQIQMLQSRCESLAETTEKAVKHVSRENRRRARRPPPTDKQVRSYVQNTVLKGGWDPSSWDGNIWDNDDDDDPPREEEYDPYDESHYDDWVIDPPTPVAAKPVNRRRKLQEVIPDAARVVRDANGVPVVNDEGMPVLEPQPQPTYNLVTEDYTAEEINSIHHKFKQRLGEDLDTWLLRMYDDGAKSVLLDGVDMHQLLGMANDKSLNQAAKDSMEDLGEGETSTLLAMYANAIRARYEMDTDWPAKKGWHSIREAVQGLRELSVRTALMIGQVDELGVAPMTRPMREWLVKNAPVAYKAPVLTLVLADPAQQVTSLVGSLRELSAFGDWEADRRDRDSRNRDTRPPGSRPTGTGGSGKVLIPRKELWAKLLAAGVKPTEIDGLPTNQLFNMCKNKGLLGPRKAYCVQQTQCQGACACACQNKSTSPPEKEDTTSEEEEEDEEIHREAQVRKVDKKRGKKGKNKGKREVLYPVTELQQHQKRYPH